MVKEDGGQAYPVALTFNHDYGESGRMERGIDGMNLRDWFAGQALAGGISIQSANQGELSGYTLEQVMAAGCYLIADALLKERQQ